ncbi:MAG: hypothetical protein AB1659_13770, partial [Thermodesulfobacteriota bacterium]
MFTFSFYIALSIFLAGTIYNISKWFRHTLDPPESRIGAFKRLGAAFRGVLLTLFSAKILEVIRIVVLDVLLQLRVLRESFMRWLMHMLIFWGFLLLILMHALEKFISEPLFPGYYSTLNPFLFLRDCFAAMAISGVGIAVFRRFILRIPRMSTTAMDAYAATLVALILISGLLLEGVKFTSHTAFMQMEKEYSTLEDSDEIKALESFWVHDFGLVSPNVGFPFDEKRLSSGKALHMEYCAECHSRPQT